MVRARDRHTNVPRPAPSGHAGLGHAAIVHRVLGPGRGRRPRGAQESLEQRRGGSTIDFVKRQHLMSVTVMHSAGG